MSKITYDDVYARELLQKLGIVPRYKGYQIVLSSLDCIADDEKSLTALKKEICIPVSEKLRCGSATVEAGIRRSAERAWQCNAELLTQISPQQLNHRPSARQFLEILYLACCNIEA